MSGDATSWRPFDEQQRGRRSPLADVNLAGLGAKNREKTDGSGSTAESSQSSRAEWNEKEDRAREKFLTPVRTDRKREHDGDTGSSNGSGGRAERKVRSRGWLLDSVVSNGVPKGRSEEKKAQKGTKKSTPNRFPTGSSHGSSPLSREVPVSQSVEEDGRPRSRPTSMDPAQLVQMALSLSESRRRHASNPIALAVPSIALGAAHGSGAARLDDDTQNQRRATSLNSDSLQDSLSSRLSSQLDRQPSTGAPFSEYDNNLYTFSPATLARAEKARRYFALADEHRRLLLLLPPLRPDANAPGDSAFETTSSLGPAQPDIRRVRSGMRDQHELGRPYNPLQSLRDRKLRHRERMQFTTPPEQFQNTIEVAKWLEEIEAAAKSPEYRAKDNLVRLPPFASGTDNVQSVNGQGTVSHRRTDTAGTVITRPNNDWSIDPAELLADAYWTEQGDNKTLIEDRNSRRIFPAAVRPRRNIAQHQPPLGKASLERGNDVDGGKDGPADQGKTRHRSFLPLPAPDRIRHNRLTRFSRSASASSESSVEGRRPLPLNAEGGHENIGPLQRHMDEIIAKDLNGESVEHSSKSPDLWDSNQPPLPRERPQQPENEEHEFQANGFLTAPPRPQHRRSQSADGRVGSNDRSSRSMDSFAIADKVMPSIETDTSPPPARRSGDATHRTKSRLPLFRSRSKDRTDSERHDFAASPDDERWRQTDGPVPDSTRFSIDSVRPTEMKRLKTADSLSGSMQRATRTNTESGGSVKEPGSAVGRFLRRGRLGDIVRNERSRFGDRIRGRARNGEEFPPDVSGVMSEPSDEEGSVSDPIKVGTSADESEASPRGSPERKRSKSPTPKSRTRYHIPNLPSFKTSSARDSQLATILSSDSDDHISRQQADLRYRNRSPRFERLAPPRINLPADERGESAFHDVDTNRSDAADERRKSYGFLSPAFRYQSRGGSRTSLGQPGRAGGMPVTVPANFQSQSTRSHRNWSISDNRISADQPAEKKQKIGARDVARVRALLLASGIKARELTRRLNAPSAIPPAFLEEAAETSCVPLSSMQRVPQKEEHLLAARLLSSHLDAVLDDLRDRFDAFQSQALPALTSRHEALRDKASENLTHLVHNTSDAADAFNIELGTQATLRTKQIDDAVDAILRLRRRQFRLLRRAGFKLLEWMVLGLLWWVWFIVVCFKTVRRIVVGILGLLRWLFTF